MRRARPCAAAVEPMAVSASDGSVTLPRRSGARRLAARRTRSLELTPPMAGERRHTLDDRAIEVPSDATAHEQRWIHEDHASGGNRLAGGPGGSVFMRRNVPSSFEVHRAPAFAYFHATAAIPPAFIPVSRAFAWDAVPTRERLRMPCRIAASRNIAYTT
jgi:hypothetical protein